MSRFLRRELVERILRWCAVGLSIAAIVCGVASVMFDGEVRVSASLIVGAVVLGFADFVCIATLGFTEAYSQLRKAKSPD